VGLALGAVAVPIVVAVLVFGIASAIMSVIGLELGAKLGTAAGEHGEVAAGVILIGVAAAMAAGWLLSRQSVHGETSADLAGGVVDGSQVED
jgi:putative Mn2+ efflux pump MntP